MRRFKTRKNILDEILTMLKADAERSDQKPAEDKYRYSLSDWNSFFANISEYHVYTRSEKSLLILLYTQLCESGQADEDIKKKFESVILSDNQFSKNMDELYKTLLMCKQDHEIVAALKKAAEKYSR